MIKYWKITIVVTLCLGAKSMLADQNIFDCLQEKNYDCLQQEFNLDPNWAHHKNSQRLKPLQVAISMKDGELVKFLLKSGAKAKDQHIYLAMKSLFDVSANDLDKLAPKPTPQNARLSFMGQLILASELGPRKSRDFSDLIEILDLFGSREDLALSIRALSDLKLLKDRELKFLTVHYASLFLQDLPLTTTELKIIISALLAIGNHNHLLGLIFDNFAQSNLHKRLKSGSSLMRPRITKPLCDQEIVRSITEKSQHLFLAFSPAILVRIAVMGEAMPDKSEMIRDFEDNIFKLIQQSFKDLSDPEAITQQYLVWVGIYQNLIANDNLMGAFSIASQLNSSALQKKINPKIYRELAITNLMGNFKDYRKTLDSCSQRYYIPALAVHLHDLSAMKELDLINFVENKGHLNEKALQFYKAFRKSFSAAYHRALMRKA